MKNFVIFYCVVELCPKSFPHAFLWGEYCCKSAKEDQPLVPLDECDGGTLALNSLCCENSEYQKCSGTRGCRNNGGITIKRY